MIASLSGRWSERDGLRDQGIEGFRGAEWAFTSAAVIHLSKSGGGEGAGTADGLGVASASRCVIGVAVYSSASRVAGQADGVRFCASLFSERWRAAFSSEADMSAKTPTCHTGGNSRLGLKKG